MAIKNLIAHGIGFNPGSISFIPTLGFSVNVGGGGGNTKKIRVPHNATGLTVYVIILRVSDGFLLNDVDGIFGSSPTDPYKTLTEHSVIKGLYETSESRTVWSDGRYYITAYHQVGGAPTPASDTMIAAGDYSITGDIEVYADVLLSSRLAASAYTSPDNAGIAALPTLSEIETSTVLAKETTSQSILTESQSHPTLGEIEASTVLAKESTTQSILTIVTLLNKYVRNKKEIKAVGSVNHLYIYDNDGTTVLIDKTLKDKLGNDITALVAGVLAIEGASSV